MNPYEQDEGSGWGTAAGLAGLAALMSPFGRPVRNKIKAVNARLGDPLAPVTHPLMQVAQNLKGAAYRTADDAGGLGELMSRAYKHRAPEAVGPAEEGFSRNAFDAWENTKGIGRALAEAAKISPALFRNLEQTAGKGFSEEAKEAFKASKLAKLLGDEHVNGILSLGGFEHPNDAAAFYLKRFGQEKNMWDKA